MSVPCGQDDADDKTREVIGMLRIGRHIGLGTVIGVMSHADSELREPSDIVDSGSDAFR